MQCMDSAGQAPAVWGHPPQRAGAGGGRRRDNALWQTPASKQGNVAKYHGTLIHLLQKKSIHRNREDFPSWRIWIFSGFSFDVVPFYFIFLRLSSQMLLKCPPLSGPAHPGPRAESDAVGHSWDTKVQPWLFSGLQYSLPSSYKHWHYLKFFLECK